MKVKLLASLVLIVFLVMFFGISDAAEKKLASSITAYMGLSPTMNGEVTKFIKENLGVEVKQTFMSYGEIGAKMKAEAPRFSADMCIGIGTPQAVEAKKEKWSIPYASPTWEGESELWRDPDNYYYNIGLDALACVINKDMLAEKGYALPKSWDDLLDPKWKGQLVVPSTLTSGNGYKIVYGIMQLYGFNLGKGEKGGWEFLEALDKQIHHYTRSGSAPIELVSKGEFMIGIGDNIHVLERMKQGYPIVLVGPKEGTSGDGSWATILKGTKKEYTCQKIIDFLGTKEFCNFFGTLVSAATKDPKVSLPLYEGRPEYPEGKPIYIPGLNLSWAAENRNRLAKEWKARFLVKGREPQ